MGSPLYRLWMATVEDAPSAVALVDASSGRSWKRSVLAREAQDWAAGYRDAFPSHGRERILMSEQNGVDWFRAFLGILCAGATPVPVDPSEPEAAQAEAARAVGAALVWRSGRLHEVG